MRNSLTATLLVLLMVMPLPAQYQVAMPGYHYEFPRDHFNHPEYRTEWWYYTGNLKAADGHRFGYELTFFRLAVSRDPSQTGPWAVNDLYVAHLALSDIDGGRYYHTQRVNRPGPGLAGASLQEKRVWNGNWQTAWSGDSQQLQAVSEAVFSALSTCEPQAAGDSWPERCESEVGGHRPRLALHFVYPADDRWHDRPEGKAI